MISHAQPAAPPTDTAPAYSPGLQGVIAGETAICRVDPDAGLLYRGYDIHELAQTASFEQVVWLLLHDDLPAPMELASIRQELAEQNAIPPAVIDMLRFMPANAHPMDALRTGISMLAAFDPDLNDNSHDANLRKSIRLIARAPTVLGAAWRTSQGLEPAHADGDGRTSFASRLLYALNAVSPEPWQAQAMNIILNLYAEHDFNASTFAARVTASTLADIYAAATSAIGALKGPLHGGANEQATNALLDVESPDNAAAWVRARLASGQKIMGFGHRIYKRGDSRVPIMRQLAREIGHRLGQGQWADICEALEEAMQAEKSICANVDLYAAPVMHMLDIPPILNTPIFACARMAGWCAHVTEQHDHNRLIRPNSLYTGPGRRSWPIR
jgi:citrate synthase